ncbi:MAG: Gfo/Idh/MocA family protein [Planctomycetota bacterium]|jgi:predicted dehydrogenase
MKRTDDDKKHDFARRDFLKSAGAAAAGTAALTSVATFAAETSAGANERLGVGFIGTGGRAGAHMNIVNKLKEAGRAEPVAVCDVYGPRVRAAAKRTGGKIYRDYRELLDDPNVDLVCIASPDRQHAPQAIDAVRAGKDVYVEKPLTHWLQFDLAKQLAEEAEKHGRIVQVGTQYMADEAYAKAHDLVEQGVIGKIVHIQAGYFRRGDWGERMHVADPNAKPGPDLDWEQFLGDAPKVPYTVSRFFQWRLYWDYSGGPATDLLVHTFTPLFRLLDVDYPERVVGAGGMFQYNDLREVPDTFNMTIDYPGGPSVVLMNTLSNATGCSTLVRGTDGTLAFEGRQIVITRYDAKEPSHVISCPGHGDTAKLWANFIDCVESRRKPLSPVEIGAKVQAPLNMAILSYRENKVARFDRDKQTIVL